MLTRERLRLTQALNAVGALSLIAPLAACDLLNPGQGQSNRGTPYTPPSVEVGVSCENGFSIEALRPAPDGSMYAKSARGVHRTTDQGRTWERVDPGDPGEPALSFIRDAAYNDIIFVDERTWLLRSQAWAVGTEPIALALSEDAGRTWQAAAVRDQVTVPGHGVMTAHTLADGRYIINLSRHLYLTAPDGALLRPLSALTTSVAAGDRAVFISDPRPESNPMDSYLYETANLADPTLADLRPVEVPIGDPPLLNSVRSGGPLALKADGTLAVSMEGAVFVRYEGSWSALRLPTVRDVDGFVAPGEAEEAWFVGDDLWVSRYVFEGEGGPYYELYRALGGAVGRAVELERVTLRAGEERLDRPRAVSTLTLGPEGDTWAVIGADPTVERSQRLVCRLVESPEGEPIAPLITGTPTAFEPGRLYLHARRGEGSEVGDRLALQQDGHAFVSAWRHLLGAPPPARPLLDVNSRYSDARARVAGVSTLRGLEVFVNDFGRDTQTPELKILKVSALTGAVFEEVEWRNAPAPGRDSQPLGDVYGVTHIEGETLLATVSGTWPRSAAERAVSTPLPGIARATPAGFATFKRTHGARLIPGRPELGWVTPIGLARLGDGELPREGQCNAESERPEDLDGCVLYPGEALVATADSAGALYVVDGRRGRVARRAPEGGEFETIAEGLLHPADLALREEGGAVIAYVLDGDVWAFQVTPGAVARRSSASAMTPYLSLTRDPAEGAADLSGVPLPRDEGTCERGAEPCVSPSVYMHDDALLARWRGFVPVFDDQTLCLPGEGYGDPPAAAQPPNPSAGLYAEGRLVETYEWSNSNICLNTSALPPSPKLGTLWVARADGKTSQAIPYVRVSDAPGAPSPFERPMSLPWDTKTARVLTSCRSGREEGCSLAIYGDLNGLPQPLVAQIGGMRAPIRVGAGGQGVAQYGVQYVFEWPEGLPPGRHTFDLEGLTAEVELVDHDKRTVARAFVDMLGVPGHEQAMVEVGGRLLGVVREGRWGAKSDGTPIPDTMYMTVHDLDAGGRYGQLPDDQHSLSEDLPRLTAHGEGALLAVRRARYTRSNVIGSGREVIEGYQLTAPVTAGLFELALSAAGVPIWSALPDVAIPDGSAEGALLAVASHQGEPWVALTGEEGGSTWLMRLTAEGWAAGAQVPGVARAVVVTGGRAWVVLGAQVVPVDLAAEPVVGDPVELPPGVVAVGPHGDALAVAAERNGVAALHTLSPTANAFSEEATLPDLPGLFTQTADPITGAPAAGLSAVVGDGVRLWVAVGRRAPEVSADASFALPEDGGLRLARLEGGAWSLSDEVSGSGAFDRCTGAAWDERSRSMLCAQGGGAMVGGCTLFACQLPLRGNTPRHAAVGRVSLSLRGGRAVALFDSVFGAATLEGGADTQVVSW